MTSAPALLALLTVAWPVAMAAALVDRFDGMGSTATVAVYTSCAAVCHQRPERSFTTFGYQWPVCGRCSGLYLAAPVGALAGLGWRRRIGASRLRVLLVLAALPTLASLALEGIEPDAVSSLHRALAAAPLGVGVAFAAVWVAAQSPALNRID